MDRYTKGSVRIIRDGGPIAFRSVGLFQEMSYVVTPAWLDIAPTFPIPWGAENRCFCHKNAQPKQTGPSSKNCGIQDSDSIYLCSSLMFQKIKEIVWHGHFSGKVIHRYIYNYCKKLGIKGHSAMHLSIAKMIMKFIYRMSTNSSVYEYIKFCVIFMERDILLLTSTKHT